MSSIKDEIEEMLSYKYHKGYVCPECALDYDKTIDRLLALMDKVVEEVIGNTPIYDVADEHPQFIRGYNIMAESARLMRAEQRQTYNEMRGEK